jgi:hypothetical protein
MRGGKPRAKAWNNSEIGLSVPQGEGVGLT